MTRILYATAYGSTQQYAEELGRRLGVTPELIDDTDPAAVTGTEPIVVLSYTHGPKVPAAGFINSLDVEQRPVAACAVGMSLREEVLARDPLKGLLGAKADQVERFYLPGRLNYSELSSAHSRIMFGLVTALKLKPGKTPNEKAMVENFKNDVDHVDFAALDDMEAWVRSVDKQP